VPLYGLERKLPQLLPYGPAGSSGVALVFSGGFFYRAPAAMAPAFLRTNSSASSFVGNSSPRVM